jgi:hypothetical protein
MLFTKNSSKSARGAAGRAAFVLAFIAVAGAQAASAHSGKVKSVDRAMQAHVENAAQASRTCIPANGAQILGGFAGPDDLIDVNTGVICGKR